MYLLMISTICCILEYAWPFIIKHIIARLHPTTFVDSDLRDEMKSLKQEMASLSMVDDFAKYAKLQRKCNKLDTTMKEQLNERISSRNAMQTNITRIFRSVDVILTSIVVYMYGSRPVIIFPKGTMWPFEGVLSWPSKNPSAISLMNWLVICRMAIANWKNLSIS